MLFAHFQNTAENCNFLLIFLSMINSKKFHAYPPHPPVVCRLMFVFPEGFGSPLIGLV